MGKEETVRVRHYAWDPWCGLDIASQEPPGDLDWPMRVIEATNTVKATPNCYCSLWDTKPDFLPSFSVPKSHCGICSICGKPGHVRHYPGPVACSGSWCNDHLTQLVINNEVLTIVLKQINRASVKKPSCLCKYAEIDMSELGIPGGHCGYCEACGKPGHIRILPALPELTYLVGQQTYPRGWCDEHFSLIEKAIQPHLQLRPWWKFW